MSDDRGLGTRYFPVALDLQGRRCIVVGGGRIGTRKALALAAAGADVVVISPNVTSALRRAAGEGAVGWLGRPYADGMLGGAFLVVAATDSQAVNGAVAEEAARMGALALNASSAEGSNVIFGAQLRTDGVNIAVFTDGRDPAHARRTRDRIASFLEVHAEQAHQSSAGSPEGRVSAPPPREMQRPEGHAARPGLGDRRPYSPVMIGAAVANGWGNGGGPRLTYSDPRAFARVKRSRKSLHSFLGWVRERVPGAGALVWNTCQRTECYLWLPAALQPGERERYVADIRRELFGEASEGLGVNVLTERDARHHLLRTACGMNSNLPGDRDVTAQLQSACRISECAGTAVPPAATLVEEAVALADEVRQRTPWGEYSIGYCDAALARVREVEGAPFETLRHVAIGGSSTSRSVLTALRTVHGVSPRQVTLVYRDHHGQMKQLRSAIGSGRRLRVHAYSDEAVLRAMAEADCVFFGIDQVDPVIEADAVASLRDFATRPLSIVDFNSFGSLGHWNAIPGVRVWTAKELDEAVAAHAAVTMTRTGFADALAAAEAWIAARLQRTSPAGDVHADAVAPARRAEPAC
jgi:siroheme synthase-like protein